MNQAIASTAQWLGDQITDWTGLAALRVPLERASGPRAETLAIPGYTQTNSYGCGAVAAVMVVRYFHPRMQFGAVYEAVAPLPDLGAHARQVARAMRLCGLRVTARRQLQFGDLCQCIKAGSPVLAVIRNPGADCRHWVVVYGYRRIPDQVYLANNGLPWFTRNRVASSVFEGLWDPEGNGLICSKTKERQTVRTVRVSFHK
ncbi:MAG: C39 family peptidase [Verrucomicrobia bacterium]|nr:C39 family peptidase [Verrucomicrobiota bacterium]